jgi:hypothetical protein
MLQVDSKESYLADSSAWQVGIPNQVAGTQSCQAAYKPINHAACGQQLLVEGRKLE